ncbi:hypothetical protein SKAU_G00234200 [Synaphobranchus kaupii]|uniref:Gypsy retrotransposon integrase-like protein 1 n=1 Tax=Synaphobranchus kaupii TaxID=118154 RepID=A0A9Q1F6N7_SYNKA|nr:hypothetical protein SKAU_G00234200 [Synaphobranchus kaupii]
MEIDESSRKFLTINTHKRLFQYNRLVFGVASAPAIWQRAMDQVLQYIPGTQCYLDDIIVMGKNDEEHLQNLSRVLTRLSEYGLRAKRSKFPSKLRTSVLENLHEGHLGTVKMKSLARSYIWWPGIDKQIEDLTKSCSGCHRVQNAPPQAPLHPWEWPSAP